MNTIKLWNEKKNCDIIYFNKGLFDTGDLQVTIKNAADFEKAKPLLERAYNKI